MKTLYHFRSPLIKRPHTRVHGRTRERLRTAFTASPRLLRDVFMLFFLPPCTNRRISLGFEKHYFFPSQQF